MLIKHCPLRGRLQYFRVYCIYHHYISASLQRNYPFSMMIRDYVCCFAAHGDILNTHLDENDSVARFRKNKGDSESAASRKTEKR